MKSVGPHVYHRCLLGMCHCPFFWMGEYRKFFKSSILSFYAFDKTQVSSELEESWNLICCTKAFSIRASVYI